MAREVQEIPIDKIEIGDRQRTDYGDIEDLALIMDRETGRPRGFAFVTMSDGGEAQAAIESLNGTEVDGRTLVVNEARPKSEGGRSGGGGRRRW